MKQYNLKVNLLNIVEETETSTKPIKNSKTENKKEHEVIHKRMADYIYM